MDKNKKQVVIIFGPPGSGKGTQAGLFSEKLGLYYLETSKLIEAGFNNSDENDFVESDGKKYYFKDQKKFWTGGQLCDSPFVTELMNKKIQNLFAEKEGIILAGSPRTIYEAEKEIPLLKELYGVENIKVINLELSAERTLFRNTHRRICKLMRHPIIFSSENEKLTKCPLDGSLLASRGELDKPETIEIRLKEYEERTKPVLDLLETQGLEIKNIDGQKTVEEVFNDILKVLK
jgi:adenylate kinase